MTKTLSLSIYPFQVALYIARFTSVDYNSVEVKYLSHSGFPSSVLNVCVFYQFKPGVHFYSALPLNIPQYPNISKFAV